MNRNRILRVITIILASVILIKKDTNNVCRTFWDYYSNRDKNENCHYNPEAELNVPQIIRRHGYPIQTYHATTDDGYILTIFRIPHGRKRTKTRGKPVFIQHGITLNSGAFLTIGRKSLGFVLADAGYDVWLGNFRGSRYSTNHTTLDHEDSKFWDYSFHEHGIYDVPAQLDLIHNITQKKIYYIGFSMGATSAYIYGTTFPDKALEKVHTFIGIAPVGFLNKLYFAQFLSYVWPWVKTPIHALTNGKLYPRPPLPSTLYKLICLPYPIQMQICQIPDMIVFGFDYEQNDPESLPATLIHNSDTTTTKIITHYSQWVLNGNFQQFDYGTEENKRIYGTPEPPHYDLSKMKVPSYLISGPNDWLATKENIMRLHKSLPKETTRYDIYDVPYEKFNHIDFVTSKDAHKFVYDHIVTFIASN